MDRNLKSDWIAAARALVADPADTKATAHDGATADALAWLAGGPPLPASDWPPPPPHLVFRPSPSAPAAYHAGRLIELAGAETAETLGDYAGDCLPLQRAWHARWLWYLLAPDDPASAPKISVVIPVYNRADLVVIAVESALEQDWPAVEVVVIDDGSSDDPGATLEPYADRIVFHRLDPNAGLSAARNAALALATGDVVQMLDSDDRFKPGALRAKIQALAHVPDAQICFSSYDILPLGETETEPGGMHEMGTPDCATQWPVFGMIHRLPFLISTLMVARYLLCAVGNFDRRLRAHEDRLLFQRFGLMEAKPVAIDAPLLVFRRSPDSLARAPDKVGHPALSGLIFLDDLLARPERWDLVALVFKQCFWAEQWRLLNEEPLPIVREQGERFVRWLDDFAAGRRFPEYSPRPLAAELLAVLEERGALNDEGAFVTPLRQSLRAMMAARPPGPADLELWRGSHNPPANRPAFLEIFAALSADLRGGASWVPLASLDQKPFRSLPHRWRKGWKRIAQTARLAGEGPAKLLAKLRG